MQQPFHVTIEPSTLVLLRWGPVPDTDAVASRESIPHYILTATVCVRHSCPSCWSVCLLQLSHLAIVPYEDEAALWVQSCILTEAPHLALSQGDVKLGLKPARPVSGGPAGQGAA